MILDDLELDLDVFHGPFDLLLALILREEIELAEIPIAEIIAAYIERAYDRGDLDLESASGAPSSSTKPLPASTGSPRQRPSSRFSRWSSEARPSESSLPCSPRSGSRRGRPSIPPRRSRERADPVCRGAPVHRLRAAFG